MLEAALLHMLQRE